MAISAFLDVQLTNRQGHAIALFDLLNALKSGNWAPGHNDTMTYLPIGDGGSFDWQSEVLDENALLEILQAKNTIGECIGIDLFYNHTDTGITMLLSDPQKPGFTLSINRKLLFDNVTDVSWYLKRILPCFETETITMLAFKFSQF